MKFTVQHLKYGARFWIPHCKDTLQKLMIIQRIPNGKMPCLIVISWKKWDRKPRKKKYLHVAWLLFQIFQIPFQVFGELLR